MSSQVYSPSMTQANGSMNTVFITRPRLDLSYISTVPGLLKCFVIILNLISFVCVISSPFRWNGRGVYFCATSSLAFWFSTVLLLLYVYHLVEIHHNVPWLKIEFLAYSLFTLLYMTAATVAVAFGAPAFSAAGFFGYLAMVLYGVDAFVKVRSIQAGEPAQGHLIITKQASMVSPTSMA